MKNFTRLYAEGGDILNNFYSSGAVGSNAPVQSTLLQGVKSVTKDGGKESKKAKKYNKKHMAKISCHKRNC